MTEKQVDILFDKVVNDAELMQPRGYSKHKLHNFRHPERKKTSLGAKLEVLMQLQLLQFKP
jgi:hypothetical protein